MAFNWILYYDDVNEIKSSVYLSWRQLPQLQDTDIWKKISQYYEKYTKFSINIMTSQNAILYFDFQGHYDDVKMYLMA